MENIKKYSCWDCQYFDPIDPLANTSGYCRRNAPHSLDYFGFSGCSGGASPLTTKGDVYTHDGAADARLPVGADGQVLTADAAAANGVKWAPPSGDPSPLTTKGDVYTHDGAADARLPVGADGQVLTADAAAANGVKWAPPSGGASPLTTKGDLFGFAAADARLPVGTPGQVLQADPAEATGLKWVDPTTGGVYLDTEQAFRFDSGQGYWILFTHDGEAPTASRAISNPDNQYDNGGSYPFIAPFDAATAELIAFQICLTAAAVGTGTVGANPYIIVTIYEVLGTGETLLGSFNFPVPAANVAVGNNLGTPNYHNYIYVLPTPILITAGGMWGWRFDCRSSGSNEVITAVRNINTKAYLRITPTPAIAALAAPGGRVGLLAADALAAVEPTSANKYALIERGDLGWCGEFKPNDKAIPPLPTP